MNQPPQTWVDAARKAAVDVARKLGVPDLTPKEAEEFTALGVPGMQEMIGYPVGITPADYKRFQEESGSASYSGPDMNFLLYLARGEHLQRGFLAGVSSE